MTCDHANEVPHRCRCVDGCRCRTEGSCAAGPRVVPLTRPAPPSEGILDLLTMLLDKAVRGELTGLAAAWQERERCRPGTYTTVLAVGCNGDALLGTCHRMVERLASSLEEP